MRGGGYSNAEFLIKSGNSFYQVSIAPNADENEPLVATPRFPTEQPKDNSKTPLVPQGIHFDSGRIYVAFSWLNDSKNNDVYYYNYVDSSSQNIEPILCVPIQKQYGRRTFEIEGISFRKDSGDRRLWFGTFEGEAVQGGIYTTLENIN